MNKKELKSRAKILVSGHLEEFFGEGWRWTGRKGVPHCGDNADGLSDEEVEYLGDQVHRIIQRMIKYL